MQIIVNNMLGIEKQALEIAPGVPHAIVGINASGKTSLVSVIAALASRSANPFGVNVSQKSGYIYRGSREGCGIMHTPDGDISWETIGGIKGLEIAMSNKAATGLVDLVNARASVKTRIEIWESILGAGDISTDILKSYFEGRDEKEYLAVCDVIDRDGWNAAAELYVAHRRVRKSDWEKIVGGGRNYSKPLAAKWSPDGWSPEDEKTDCETLEGELVDLRNILDGARSESAVSEQQVQDGIEAKERVVGLTTRHSKTRVEADVLREKMTALQTSHNDLLKKKDNVQKKIDSLNWKVEDNIFVDEKSKSAQAYQANKEQNATLTQEKKSLDDQISRGQKNALVCPHCEQMFAITQDKVIKWSADTNDTLVDNARELQARIRGNETLMTDLLVLNASDIKKKISALKVKLKKASGLVDESSTEIEAIKTSGNALVEELTTIKAQVRELERIAQFADADVKAGASEQTITDLKLAIEQKQQAIANYRVWYAARQAHDAVCANDFIVKVLSPGGAKDKVMQERFREIEAIIKNVAGAAGWSEISVDSQFGISIAGTSAAFASKSERWRAQVALQIAVFIFTQSKVLVLDECDILDDAGFNGLMQCLTRISSKFSDRYFVFAGTELSGIPDNFETTRV